MKTSPVTSLVAACLICMVSASPETFPAASKFLFKAKVRAARILEEIQLELQREQVPSEERYLELCQKIYEYADDKRKAVQAIEDRGAIQ